MKNYSYCTHLFSQQESFERAAVELLEICRDEAERPIMRITVFGKCSNDNEYEKNVNFLEKSVVEILGERAPMVSYVTQPLLDGGNYVAEVQLIDVEISFKEFEGLRYITMESDDMRRLMVCGVRGSVHDSIKRQSDDLFTKISKLFKHEDFEVSDIFRQWNYIPQITAVDGNNYQHYQAFNDSRTEFYRQADWSRNGYPAATGIGMEWGAVTVDLIAVKPIGPKMRIIPIDNDLQLAAHGYSQQVLIGAENDKVEGRSTPKFERAKALGNAEEGYICFISGTAAIRGESSMENSTAAQQAIQTMENIEHLISDHTCNKYGIELSEKEREIPVGRAYVKFPADTAEIKHATEERWPQTSMAYLLADVCREELLVEIEAVSNMPF